MNHKKELLRSLWVGLRAFGCRGSGSGLMDPNSKVLNERRLVEAQTISYCREGH